MVLCLCVHILFNHQERTNLDLSFILVGISVSYVNSSSLYRQMKFHKKPWFLYYEFLLFLPKHCMFLKNTANENQKIELTVFLRTLYLLLSRKQVRSLYTWFIVFIHTKIKFVSPLNFYPKRFLQKFVS